MLTTLSIKNYALIDTLEVDFSDGLITITGETGAGKSILLGGLSLVLGKRADMSTLKNKEEKCIIEATFAIANYHLQPFFDKENIDYESYTIIRREILPSGKSRAFINDTPVTLDTLSGLGNRLIDIHSQHQTLQLTENQFQFQVIDAVGNNLKVLENYKKELADYQEAKQKLQKLINFQDEANKEHDYNSFLLKELQEAQLQEGMLEELEAIYEKLSNVEAIKEQLVTSQQLIEDEQIGALNTIGELKNILQKLSGFGNQFEQLFNRIHSITIELDDVYAEIQNVAEDMEANPQQLEEVNTKLQKLYDLQRKHNVLEISELIAIQSELEEKVTVTENIDTEIKNAQIVVLTYEKELDKLAAIIHQNRIKAIPGLVNYMEEALSELGMENARFQITIEEQENYFSNGKDLLNFKFSANKGAAFGELKKIASGGELSRIMLTIKAVLAKHMKLPTIMFDEIDTGVSGKIADKMADIMKEMSRSMQVFTITHLPQIAAKGSSHFKVYKEDKTFSTTTQMRKLSEEERIKEIAGMLAGKEVSDTALTHAKQLLN
ncbi:DNA repair protein RecN [Leptobacterium sp. I13]|uniref:DNA repair protein RecN n=1 Tax=Leptobacterium meishanense TaxID=3128904 RepID=UPI0030EBB926